MCTLADPFNVFLDGGEAGLWVGTAADAARPYEVISATGYLGFLGNGWYAMKPCSINAMIFSKLL